MIRVATVNFVKTCHPCRLILFFLFFFCLGKDFWHKNLCLAFWDTVHEQFCVKLLAIILLFKLIRFMALSNYPFSVGLWDTFNILQRSMHYVRLRFLVHFALNYFSVDLLAHGGICIFNQIEAHHDISFVCHDHEITWTFFVILCPINDFDRQNDPDMELAHSKSLIGWSHTLWLYMLKSIRQKSSLPNNIFC